MENEIRTSLGDWVGYDGVVGGVWAGWGGRGDADGRAYDCTANDDCDYAAASDADG
jgi:hypothetical protein